MSSTSASKRIAIVVGLGLFGFAISGFHSSMPGRALAQEGLPGSKGGKGQPGGGKGQPGAKGQPGMGPGGFGAGVFTTSFDAVKTQIKATDEEWKVIGPKLREVMTSRQAVNTGMAGEGLRGGFGPGGFGGGGFGPPGGGPGGFGPPGGGPGGFGPPGGGPGGFGPPGGGPGGPGALAPREADRVERAQAAVQVAMRRLSQDQTHHHRSSIF
jgi:hypothetical protein